MYNTRTRYRYSISSVVDPNWVPVYGIRIRIRDILHGYNLQLPVNINLKKDFKKWSKSYKKNNACEESSEFLSLSHVSFFNGNNTAYFYL